MVETQSTDELDRAVVAILREHRAEADEASVVVLAGGDGTYMAGMSALAREGAGGHLPRIAFAPGGTVGTVARNWGTSRGQTVAAAARLLDELSRGIQPGERGELGDDRLASRSALRTTRRPTLRVIEADGTTRVGFIFGAGLVARFFEEYEARGAGGNLDAARIVARVFAGSFVGSSFARSILEPSACKLTVDGRPAPFERLSLLCASVVPNLGLGMKLTYRAAEELERFHVVATPQGPRALGPQMPLVLAGRPLVGPRVDSLAGRVELRFFEGGGAYVLDGDLFRGDEITVEAGPAIDVVS